MPRALITALAACSIGGAAAAEPLCQVRQSGPPPLVVELFTSEGCSSCPPAEAWLNGLKGRGDVLAMAFHVTYWDHLGWTDRLASAEGTDRQRQLARRDGSGVYTPQVRVAGQDWRRWPALPRASGTAGPGLELVRDGAAVQARVDPLPGQTLSGYWAVLEDGHASRVRAGENSGATLQHEHVVRLYRPVAAWAGSQAHRSQLTVDRGVAAHPRRVAFVVIDAITQRPLQAAVLGC